MHFKFRNINDAFHGLVEGIHRSSVPTEVQPSRNGEALRIPEPVIVTYRNPQERVLFNRARGCNCFFHLYEALWMLAGREDVEPLCYYNSNMRNYSDDGKTFHGAYGHRWRHQFGYDQLDEIIKELGSTPTSRRCVLEMWDAKGSAKTLVDGTGYGWKEGDLYMARHGGLDVPCNLCTVFEVETGVCPQCEGSGECPPPIAGYDPGVCPACKGTPHDQPRYLNMTVYNRSNDIVWGMFGANVVHFSLLQEYVACSLGLDLGVYNQISVNLHGYTEKWDAESWLGDTTPDWYQEASKKFTKGPELTMVPLLQDRERFDREVREFVERHQEDAIAGEYQEPFLRDVAQPMCIAFHHHKRRDYNEARIALAGIAAEDWRIAATDWVGKRERNWRTKQEVI